MDDCYWLSPNYFLGTENSNNNEHTWYNNDKLPLFPFLLNILPIHIPTDEAVNTTNVTTNNPAEKTTKSLHFPNQSISDNKFGLV